MPKRLILLPGPTSSGTNLMAAVFGALGCRIPQQEPRATPPPKGFGDPQWVVGFHTRLLKKAAVHDIDARPSAWALTAAAAREPAVVPRLQRWLRDEFGNDDYLVVKESRIAWFVPAWRRAGEAVGSPFFVTSSRHPLEVLAGYEKGFTDDWHPNARVAAWINMALYTERATRGDRRAIVRYEDLVADKLQTVALIAEEVGLDITDRASSPELRAALAVEDLGKERSRGTWTSLDVDDRLVELAEETHAALDDAAGGTGLDGDKIKATLDQLRQRYIDLYSFAESMAQFSIAGGAGSSALGTPTFANREETPLKAQARRLVRRTQRTKEKAARRIRRRRAGTPESPQPKGPEQ